MTVKMKIKKGDEVIVIAGRDKGKKGNVTQVLPKQSRVVVSGIQMVTKHQKPSRTSAGGLVREESSIHVSNVALLDGKSGKPTRVGYKIQEDGTKVRVSKRSSEVIHG